MSRRRVQRLRAQLDALLGLVDELTEALTEAVEQAHRDTAAMRRSKLVIAALCDALPDATVAAILDRLQRAEAERCDGCGGPLHELPLPMVQCKACGHVQPRGRDACSKCGGLSLLWARRHTDRPQA